MMIRSILLSLLFTLPLSADPYLTPREAVKKMEVPAGFSVDLIAAEPDIVQPIAFCWDSRGRMWVVEGNTYPSRQGNASQGYGEGVAAGKKDGTLSDAQRADIFGGSDRILIFSDEDGNGSFETRKIFVEKLNLVSGIEIGYDGVFVGSAPYLLHFPDKDQNDQPDADPIVMLDGWGWQDTHETLNSFIWGPDGWLYGCHGVFTHSRVGKPGTPWEAICDASAEAGYPWTTERGKRVPLNCGYWRYDPKHRIFEVYAHGTSNPWGLDYNEQGHWFSEACVIPHFWHIIPGGYYLRQSNPLGHFNPHVYTNIETIADHKHYGTDSPHAGNASSDAFGGGHAHCGLCIYYGQNFPQEYWGRPMFFNVHGQRINQENLVKAGSGYVAKHLPDFLKTHDKNFSGVALKVGPDGAVYFIDWYDKQKCHLTRKEVWDRSNGRIYRVKYDKTWKAWKGDAAKMDITKSPNPNGWLGRMLRSLQQNPVPASRPADAPVKTETAADRLQEAVWLQRQPAASRWTMAETLVSNAEDASDQNLPQMLWYAIEPLVALDSAKALELAARSKIPLVSKHIARRVANLGEGATEQLVQAIAREKTGEGVLMLMEAALEGVSGRSVSAPAAWQSAYDNIQDIVDRRPDAREKSTRILDVREALAVAFGDQRAFPSLRKRVLDATQPKERREQSLQILVRGKDPELPMLVKTLLDDPALRLAALRVLPQAMEKLP